MDNILYLFAFKEISSELYADIIKQTLPSKSFNHIKTIILLIDSVGGDVEEGLAIIDYLRNLKKKIITVNMGKCYSMALNLFLLGKERYCFPNTNFLLHNTILSLDNSIIEVKKELQDVERMDEELNKEIIKKTNIKKKELNKLLKMDKDVIFTADQSLKNGISHYMITNLSQIFETT